MFQSDEDNGSHSMLYTKSGGSPTSSARSSASSSSMEDYLKKLFSACDRDGDGYLDRHDLEEVCRQLGLEEENVSEILEQLGAGETGKISYEDFTKYKGQLLCEMSTGHTSSSESNSAPELSTDTEKEIAKPRVREKENKPSRHVMEKKKDITSSKRAPVQSGLTINTGQTGVNLSLQEFLDPQTLQQLQDLQVISPKSSTATGGAGGQQPRGTDFLEIANRLHLAALTSLKNEIFDLNSRLHHVTAERDIMKNQLNQLSAEKQKLQKEYEERLQSQMMRVTELQSVIAELTRKYNEATGNVIAEEEEEDAVSQSSSDLEAEEGFSNRSEGSHGSDCSCDNCENHEGDDGPNQVNFLATTIDGPNQVNFSGTTNEAKETETRFPDKETEAKKNVENFDFNAELSRVLGAIECTLTDRKKISQRKDVESDGDESDGDCVGGQGKCVIHDEPGRGPPVGAADRTIDDEEKHPETKQAELRLHALKLQIHELEERKKALQKEVQQINVEEYVTRRAADTALEDEINTLQNERELYRSKLRRAECDLEELKAANITIREEREKLRKRSRSLQDALERRSLHSTPSPLPPTSVASSSVPPSPTPSGHVRSSSMSTSNIYSTHSPVQSRKTSQPSPGQSRKTSQPTTPSISSTLQSTHSSPFTPVPPKRQYTGSPGSSLQRQNVVTSSDLGSSIGDDFGTSELSQTLVRCLRGRIPETLLQTLVTYNNLDQVLVSLQNHFETDVIDRVREMDLEIERLTSRMSHLKSQNDLLQLCLEESKGNAERLSILVSKYEGNNTALHIALQNTDQLNEAYEIMLQLQESEQDLIVANYQASNTSGPIFNTDTMKSLTSTHSSKSNVSGASSQTSNSHYQLTYGEDILQEDEDGFVSIRNSQTKRRSAESQAKLLLQKLDKKYEGLITGHVTNVTGQLWEDGLDYNSRTSTVSSANSSNIDSTLSKDDESRLRDYIQVLKSERSTVETTIMEVESAQDVIEPLDEANLESDRDRDRNMDLETAVLLQELQAHKEERAELKHKIYLLEKERRALELKLSSREAQEQAYIVHIEHLKSEVKEQIKKRKLIIKEGKRLGNSGSIPEDDDLSSTSGGNATPLITLAELRTSEEDIPADLYEAHRREKKYKSRIQELVETLEKLSKNSEIRHQQTAEYIADLKRANGALVSAYEKAKKRHASRLKKFEAQLITMAERHQEQIRILKERISKLEEDKVRTRNETSL